LPRPSIQLLRWRPALGDAFVVGALYFLAALVRLPLAPLMELSSDATDPILGALRTRDGEALLDTRTALFGWARELSYLPLVVAAPQGLLDLALRKSLLHALVPPLAYLAGRAWLSRSTAREGSALGPALGAALLLFSQELLDSVSSGYQSYFATEWGTALLAVSGLLAARRTELSSALATGLCLAFAAMNHPFAASLIVVPLSTVLAGRGLGRRSAPLLSATLLGTTLLLLLPHAAVVARQVSAGSVGLGALVRESAEYSSLGPWRALRGLLLHTDRPATLARIVHEE
jgi:hypothetical protein